MMKILWTRSKLPLSKLICKVTNEPVSHVAISYNSLVFHADFLGVRVISQKAFCENHEIVFEIELNDRETRLINLIDKFQGRFYDFGAFLFLGISLILRHYFRIPLPKSNLWQVSGMFICTEWVSDIIDQKADSMITPYGLYLRLNKK